MSSSADNTPVGPAYGGLCPRAGTKAGPQCSSFNDFCFLCEDSAGPVDASVTSLVSEVKQLALSLAGEHKELPVIVNAVARAYNENCKAYVEWRHPRTKKTIRGPVWSRDSITRHLLYSVEFPLFDESVNQIYHSLIVAEQNVVMDPTTNRVRPAAKKELLKTIGSYAKWLETRDRLGGAKRKRVEIT